uniref:Uncharacterized protein n=1 Tax=Chlamydomonas leiostraca TaxID=1034604 RepID=A0A7S0S5A4_9CHLO
MGDDAQLGELLRLARRLAKDMRAGRSTDDGLIIVPVDPRDCAAGRSGGAAASASGQAGEEQVLQKQKVLVVMDKFCKNDVHRRLNKACNQLEQQPLAWAVPSQPIIDPEGSQAVIKAMVAASNTLDSARELNSKRGPRDAAATAGWLVTAYLAHVTALLADPRQPPPIYSMPLDYCTELAQRLGGDQASASDLIRMHLLLTVQRMQAGGTPACSALPPRHEAPYGLHDFGGQYQYVPDADAIDVGESGDDDYEWDDDEQY